MKSIDDLKFSKSDFEYVKCPLCKSNDYSEKFRRGQLVLVNCNKCGMAYLNPRVKQGIMMRLYNEGYFSSYDYYVETSESDCKSFEGRLEMIERQVSKGKLLDAGCSVGSFLLVAKKRGWKVVGFDINKKAISQCKQNGLEAYCTTLEDAKFKPKSFDVITMNDYIEHVSDPIATLLGAHRLLKDNGVLFLSTPDIGAFMARLFGKRWVHLKPWQHLFFFSTKTMKQALRKAGFSMLSKFSLGRYRSIGVLVDRTDPITGKYVKYALHFVIPRRVKSASFYLDSGDEMGVIAVKAKSSDSN